VIVTYNLRDFPEETLAAYGIEAQHPDEFVSHLFDLDPGVVCAAVRDQRESLKNPPVSVDELLNEFLAWRRPCEPSATNAKMLEAGFDPNVGQRRYDEFRGPLRQAQTHQLTMGGREPAFPSAGRIAHAQADARARLGLVCPAFIRYAPGRREEIHASQV
jgi:hypothetical protein